MYRKSLFSFLFIVAAFAALHIGVSAQTAPVTGKVEMENTHEPVVGALVEVYRTDIRSGFPSTKTNKKGEFSFAGMLLGARYAFSVSAPNCEPSVFPEVKAGQEKLLITLRPGDGRKLTETDARKSIAEGAKAGPGTPEMSEADKKAREDYEKKLAANNVEKKKAEDSNKIINAALKEGAAAFDVHNYDLAVAKFDEGYNADPEFEGSAPIMLTNKGLALRERGLATFRQAASGEADAKAAALEKVKADFVLAIAAFDKALEILGKASAGDAKSQGDLTLSKTSTLKGYVTTQAAMVKLRLDPTKTADAVPILNKYIAAEPDDAKKLPVLMNWANYMRESGETKFAIPAYRTILEKNPDNIDAWAGIGLSLFAEGVGSVPENKEQMQEGLNFMQKFAETAPDTHPLKASVKESVDYLKNTAKLAPQKVPPTPKRKP